MSRRRGPNFFDAVTTAHGSGQDVTEVMFEFVRDNFRGLDLTSYNTEIRRNMATDLTGIMVEHSEIFYKCAIITLGIADHLLFFEMSLHFPDLNMHIELSCKRDKTGVSIMTIEARDPILQSIFNMAKKEITTSQADLLLSSFTVNAYSFILGDEVLKLTDPILLLNSKSEMYDYILETRDFVTVRFRN